MSTVRSAIITGGSRGIGLSIAQLLARNSYACTLISRNEHALQSAIATLPQATASDSRPLRHNYIKGDINDPLFWKKPMFNRLPAPTVDVLINCAGVTQGSLFTNTYPEGIENIVSTNLTSLMWGTKFLIKGQFLRGRSLGSGAKAASVAEDAHVGAEEEVKSETKEEAKWGTKEFFEERMQGKGKAGELENENEKKKEKEETKKRHSPVVINVASLLGLKGGFGAVAYAASKAGVLGFTRALATEIGPMGIRVNAIVPGYVDTEMTKKLDQVALSKQIPLRRFGKPEEIASAALFLIENEYAHNCVINLDGGLSAM